MHAYDLDMNMVMVKQKLYCDVLCMCVCSKLYSYYITILCLWIEFSYLPASCLILLVDIPHAEGVTSETAQTPRSIQVQGPATGHQSDGRKPQIGSEYVGCLKGSCIWEFKMMGNHEKISLIILRICLNQNLFSHVCYMYTT